MSPSSVRDLAGGLLLLAVGGWIALHAGLSYEFGTIRRMGSGLFPALTGAVLLLFGGTIAGVALWRGSASPVARIEVRSAAAVLASVATFATLIVPFGLLPAVAGLVLVAGLAEARFRTLSLLVSVLVLAVLALLIFRVGLGLPLVMVRGVDL